MSNSSVKALYNNTLSQTINDNYLAAGNNYGNIGIFDLTDILDPDYEEPSNYGPMFVFDSPNSHQVCSLASTSKFLLAGTVGSIFGFTWKEVINDSSSTSWKIDIPSKTNDECDVNSMVIGDSVDGHHLYVGAGDNNVYLFDLEDGRSISKLTGHTDYIHSVKKHGKLLGSASEDGTVRLWDIRTPISAIGIIQPSKEHSLVRQSLGKWIGDLDLSDDWLVCGGGVRLSLWHIRSLNMVSEFPDIQDNGIHVTSIISGDILAGGNCPYLYSLSNSGRINSKLDSSSPSLYSLAYSADPKVLSFGGSGPDIDLSTNMVFKDSTLKFM